MRKALRSAIDDAASDHRHRYGHLLYALLRTRKNVLRKHDEIGKLTRLDRALEALFERQVRVVDGFNLQRFLAGDLLLRAHHAAADRVARHEMIEDPERWIRHDRGVGTAGDDESLIEVGA